MLDDMLTGAAKLKICGNDPQLLSIRRLKQSSVLTATIIYQPIPGIQGT